MVPDLPRESRLFADEALQRAPRLGAALAGALKALVDEKAAAGRIAPADPRRLAFSIWTAPRRHADFDARVRAVLGRDDAVRFEDAASFLDHLFARALAPGSGGRASG